MNKKTMYLTQSGLIAGIYIALTLLFQPISFGEVQVRIAEILTILPYFTPAAIPGLFIGCILANIFGGAMALDVVIGSLATLVAAVFTYFLRSKPIYFAPLPPVIINAFVVGALLRYIYQIPMPLWILILSVGAGEVISAGFLGVIFGKILERYKKVLFPKEINK